MEFDGVAPIRMGELLDCLVQFLSPRLAAHSTSRVLVFHVFCGVIYSS